MPTYAATFEFTSCFFFLDAMSNPSKLSVVTGDKSSAATIEILRDSATRPEMDDDTVAAMEEESSEFAKEVFGEWLPVYQEKVKEHRANEWRRAFDEEIPKELLDDSTKFFEIWKEKKKNTKKAEFDVFKNVVKFESNDEVLRNVRNVRLFLSDNPFYSQIIFECDWTLDELIDFMTNVQNDLHYAAETIAPGKAFQARHWRGDRGIKFNTGDAEKEYDRNYGSTKKIKSNDGSKKKKRNVESATTTTTIKLNDGSKKKKRNVESMTTTKKKSRVQ